jgi:hypothetical protein
MNPAQRVLKHKDFLSANWSRIGSYAYGEFLTKGRGIVAVPEADFIDAQSPAYAPIHFRYFPESEALSLMPDYEGSKEQGWLRSYEPETKVIVTVIRYDSGVSSYLIGTTPSPIESYKLERAKGN